MALSSKLTTRICGLPAGRITKWLIIAAWLAIIAVALPLSGKLSGITELNSTAESPRGAQSTRVAELTDRFPADNVKIGIVVYVRDGALTPADRAKVDADLRAFTPLAAAPIPPPTPSADGRALMLSVPLGQDTLADHAKRLRTLAGQNTPAGLQARLTGPAGSALDSGDALRGLDSTLLMVTAVIVALLLLITYRSPILWLLPLINVGIALQITNAVVYLLATYTGMVVAPGAASILTVLVFGVGTDYALLLLARYREELRARRDRHQAMAAALRRAVPAIAASAGTVCVGLLCLLASDMGFNYTLGPVGAIGILGGLAVMVTLLPAVLVVLGRWVFWPVIPHYGSAEPTGGSMWERIGRRVSIRPRLVWLGSAFVLVLLALGALGMRTGLDNEHAITPTPASVAGLRLVAAHYPAGSDRPVQVVADAAAGPVVSAAVREVPGVAQVQPAQPSTDGRLVTLRAVLAAPSDSKAAQTTVERLRTGLRAIPAAHALVGGGTAVDLDKARAESHDRRVVIPLIVAVVFLVLALLLRALVAPLLLIITVVASYFAALGTGWLLFTHLFGFPAVDTQLVLFGFLFLVALGVDYNIFLVSRMREEVAQRGHRAGVLRALTVTGGVISSAGAVLAATFGALAMLPMVFLVQIGVLVAVGVLLDTFLVRSVLVPALALDSGPGFWWPGALARHGRATEPDPGPVSGSVTGSVAGSVATDTGAPIVTGRNSG